MADYELRGDICTSNFSLGVVSKLYEAFNTTQQQQQQKSIPKWEKYLNRHSSKEVIQMTNEKMFNIHYKKK